MKFAHARGTLDDAGWKEMLEDLVAAAFNDAARRIEETQKEKMASVSSGMQLPPGFKMPF